MSQKPDHLSGGARQPDPESVGLPVRPFLYTLDQVAMMLSLSESYLRSRGLVFFFGRMTGSPKPDQIKANNIALPEDAPDWRIAEAELIRYCRRKGIKIYSRGWAVS